MENVLTTGWTERGDTEFSLPTPPLSCLGIGTASPDEIKSQVVLCWQQRNGNHRQGPNAAYKQSHFVLKLMIYVFLDPGQLVPQIYA